MRGDEAVTFPTPQEAQSAADAHCRDGADCSGTGDGLSWFMFRTGMPQWSEAVEVSLPPTG